MFKPVFLTMTLYSSKGSGLQLHGALCCGENMCLPEMQVVTVNQHCFRLYNYLVLVLGNCLLWLLTGKQKLKVFMVTVACICDLST